MGVGHRLLGSVGLMMMMAAGFPDPAAAGPPGDSTRSALVIGVGRHAAKSPKPTVGGAGDAGAVRDALRKAGWRDDQMMVLIDSAATAAAIRAGFRWLRSRSTDNSFSVFHYSGHTFQRPGDLDGDGEDLDEYLVPYDAPSVISDRELGEQLRPVRGWLWANLSGCESAGFDDGISGPRRLVTTSSAEPEKSYERPDWKMSVYVGLMVSQGMNQGMGDANRDGYVSIQEAFAYAAREAPGQTSKQSKGAQHPQLIGGDGTDWYLNPPPPPPTAPPGPSSRLRGLCILGLFC